jgi:TPR repeat protein
MCGQFQGDDAMKKTTLATLILCASLALPAQAGFEEGLAAYNRGDYVTALKELRPLAVAGNAVAQYILGAMYVNGLGVPEDFKEAAKWFRLAAEKGDTDAQYSLGWMYANGEGVPRDHREAVKWFRLAAEKGNTDAQYSLGVMYAHGEGVPRDHREAVKWFRLAAEKGNALAQNNLGAMYAYGQGVPRDRVLAYALYSLSAAGDPSPDNPAIRNRRTIVREMTPREIEAGQALTRALAQPGNFGKALDAYLYLK